MAETRVCMESLYTGRKGAIVHYMYMDETEPRASVCDITGPRKEDGHYIFEHGVK